MSSVLAHRGPDGEGCWVDTSAGAGFGHRRLAIIDLSLLAHQPMVSASGRYVLTYNGEIYNYLELRAELEAKGVRFRSHSDSEVLLEACATWGVAAVARRLIGIFAFALWDKETRTLALVRDHLGVKPLYWTLTDGVLVFGSELRALLAYRNWRPLIDRDALAAYFRHNYVPAPRTIYSGVFKLPPAGILTLRPHRAPEISAFWEPREIAKTALSEPLTLSEPDALAQLDLLLHDVVRRQMIADVPLGALLSGGIDSSTILAIMQAESATQVKSFTVGFREAAFDESRHAAQVARHLGTEHHQIEVAAEDALRLVPSIAEWFDEPFADSSQLPTFLLARMARRHVTVALSGDGGDEVFAGYNRYALAESMWRGMRRIPAALRGIAADALCALPPGVWDKLLLTIRRTPEGGDKIHKVGELLRLGSEPALYRRLVSQWDNPEELVAGAVEPRGILWDDSLGGDIPDTLQRLQLLDAVTYLPDDILTKIDRVSMAVSLEVRVPLLDPRLIEFAWRLPASMRRRNGQGKWLLRRLLHRYVPAALVERPKMGFGVPIGAWLRGPLREWAEDLLAEPRLRKDGFLNAALVRKKWEEHLSGRRNWQYPLWCVLMFQEWKQRWLVSNAGPSATAALAVSA
jgi:asparagine synthase (glutamine-hydrolysing)